MDNYTSPILGRVSLYPLNFKGADYTYIFQARNRPNGQEKDEWGRVIRADFFQTMSYHAPLTSAVQALQRGMQVNFRGKNDAALAILAVPHEYGTGANTGVGGQLSYFAPFIESMNAKPENSLTYDYYLVTDGSDYRPTTTIPNTLQVGNYVYGYNPASYHYALRPTNPSLTDIIDIKETTPQTQSLPTSEITYERYISPYSLNQQFTNIVSTMKAFDNIYIKSQSTNVVQDAPYFLDSTFETIQTALDAALESEDAELVNTLLFSIIQTYPYKVGQTVATGIPIFTIYHIDEMINYFAKRPFISENDIDPPPSDWSTDWDIYIKGAQKPDIYITMKSEKVDAWLDNLDENKSGVRKSDIKVEYRYRKAGSVGDNDIDSGQIVPWLTDTYNDTRATSYLENIVLNYGENVLNGGSEFSDLVINELMDIYASMEFRIHYWKYNSAWCRYQIGVIGSPSIPDFEKMHNIGEQYDSWQDMSTVTLHYDELPPDFDPYPTPPVPPVPPPQPTDPSPSINGTGLLTTTYKITEDNAKALGRFFWGKDLFQKIKALNMSPIENVVGLTYMPINIDGTTSVIVIGDVDTNINGDKIGGTTPIYTLGSVVVEGRYHSFLDFAPYTTAHIFLPFVGFVPIDPQVFTGKTLSVKYSYDLIAGVCNAMLFANGIYVESHQGNCGIDIPLVASNRAQQVLGIVTSLADTALSPANAAGNIALDMLSMGSDIANAASSFHSNRQGGYSPTCAWTETRECFLVLETPNAWRPNTYAHDYGRPCLSSYTIGQLSGFTVCDQTVDVSGIGGATEEEKRQIRELLTGGFYA